MDTRFATAIHILVLLHAERRGLASEVIARSVQSNPTRVRELLALLGAAGMTTGVRGRRGGTFLNRALGTISLRDVYRAIYDEPVLLPMHEPDERCPVGRHVPLALFAPFHMAEIVLETSLSETTVAEVADSVAQARTRERERERAHRRRR
jgi:DNA-binding IscR family transcriptional regulator